MAWNLVRRIAFEISAIKANLAHGASVANVLDDLQMHSNSLGDMARSMLGQLEGGVHTNPKRVAKRIKIGDHVQAIAYVHTKDGGRYVHGFGNCDPDEGDLKRGILKLDELKTVTNVAMYGEPDGSITLVGTKGQPLAALFPED